MNEEIIDTVINHAASVRFWFHGKPVHIFIILSLMVVIEKSQCNCLKHIEIMICAYMIITRTKFDLYGCLWKLAENVCHTNQMRPSLHDTV